MFSRMMLPLLLVGIILAIGTPARAQLPNMTYKYDSLLMEYPFTPTTAFPTPIPATVSATLPGNSDTIYWNLLGENNGTAPTTDGVGGIVNLDGVIIYTFGGPGPYHPGHIVQAWDKGPITVRGGRHTLEMVLDNQDLIVELDETDNWWAHQFVFTPYVLTPSTSVARGTPPDPLGGTFSIIDGSPIDYNCDGFRFATTGWWNAVTMYAVDAAEDYDLNLFDPSTGSEDGFIGSTVYSNAPAGELDALIVNRNMVGVRDYDVGVTNFSGTGWFHIEQVVSDPAWVGWSETVSFAENEYLKIWDVYGDHDGWVTASVTDSLTTGIGFKAAWLDTSPGVIGLSEVPGWDSSDENGEIRLNYYVPEVTYYGFVIWRDQAEGGAPVDLTVSIEPTPPDPMPSWPHFWYSELVPTPAPIPAGQTVAPPDTLHGYMPQTYLNFGVRNNSPVPSPLVDVGVYHDGIEDALVHYILPGISANTLVATNDIYAQEYAGGRHTLTVETDFTDSIHEISESNNIYGEQYCWSPMEIPLGGQYSKNSPGPALGGISTVDPTDLVYFNCDGYRLYTGYANWEGVILTQGPTSDYDLSIHYPLEGVKNGFDDFLGVSATWPGENDYVVFNNNRLPAMAHDLGVENFQGIDPYTIEAVGSYSLPEPVTGYHGPYNLPVSNMLHLFNVYLEADMYAFRLDNLAGSANWSFALHPNNVDYIARQQVLGSAVSNQTGPGGHEWFTEIIPAAGYYCLAVCKADPLSFDEDGTYALTILRGVSDVPDETPELPSATTLSGVHPNPFNPQTTISYELAAPVAVELAIYDVKGALVRRLVNEPMPAGRHAAVWDGKDDAGSRLASGVYLARFQAGSHRGVRKVVMVK